MNERGRWTRVAVYLGQWALLWTLLAVITSFHFFLYPGHTWLTNPQGVDFTQSLAPMLEHLQAPGFLTRDLVAMHPDLTDTVYDENTLSLAKALHVGIRQSIEIQQFCFQFAAVMGVFLLARAARLSLRFSLLCALLGVSCVYVWGAELTALGRDPTPQTFALGAVMVAAGFFATARPVGAGIAGGLALIYDARIASLFWAVAFLGMVVTPSLRRQARAMLPLLAIFVLLLANVAQLQPGGAEQQSWWGRVPEAIVQIVHYRSPNLWPASWAVGAWLFLLAGVVVYTWVLWRLWFSLGAAARWMMAGIPALGALLFFTLSAPTFSASWYFGMRTQPSMWLLPLFAFCVAGCAIAAFTQWQSKRRPEMIGLLTIALLLPLLMPVKELRGYLQRVPDKNLQSLSDWARGTWGGSMFLFPDSGRYDEPAAFRALSRRAVWVDWPTGTLGETSDSFADEWYRRWQDTMAGNYSATRLRRLLALPIDYFVLATEHRLPRVQPVYANARYLVYDANDLRSAPTRIAD